VRQHVEDEFKDGRSAHCLPTGLSMAGFFTDYRIIQTPSILVILDDNGDPARQVYQEESLRPRWTGLVWDVHPNAEPAAIVRDSEYNRLS